VRLPPQNIAEQAVPDGTASNLPYPGGLAGPSRLTFRVPDAAPPIDFRLEALLAFVGNADLLVDGPLAGQTTAIECPDRLLLVPQPSSRLIHRTHPVTAQTTGVTELWHTTLRDPATGVSGRLRAIANPSDHGDRPFATGLKKTQRDAIVALSGQSANIAASVLRLTALGATARLKSDRPPVPPNSTIGLAEWEHQTESGRDLYVRTVDQGYLFPFGHRAAITTVTQRRLVSRFPGQTAELVQKSFLAILEPERSYENLGAYPGSGREMPFVLARIASAPQEISPGAPIQVGLLLTDRAGSHIDCDAFVFFVNAGDAANNALLAPLRDRYQTMSVVTLSGQRVALAENDGGAGDTSLNVVSMDFGVKLPSELAASAVPGFLPFMATAEARIPALEQMVGTTANATPATQRRATSITFHDSYLQAGFAAGDMKQVFAKFAALADGLAIPAERAGGLAAPKFRGIDGLSRLTGPVAGVDQFVHGDTLNPEQLVGDAKLLGVIPLNKVIAAVTGGAADAFPVAQVRDLFDRVEDLGQTFVPRPVMTTVTGASGVETRFVWKPRIALDSLPAPLVKTSGQMELILKGRIMADARSPSSPPAFAVEGKLRNFAFSLLGLVRVRFDSVEFSSQSGSKVDVKPHVAGIDFLGSLAFVEKLQELLPTKSLADLPQVQTLPDGVTVRHAIAIPSVPLGVMTIENLALSSSLSLPFVEGKPAAVGFALSRRDNPFQISVSIFGGTGFFSLQALTADKGLTVEAALEFGGVAELDLVVIKGGVHVFVGIYLSMGPNNLVIEGHLRFGGYVDVLGLISISIEFYLALTYVGSRNVLSGSGRLTVGVKLLFYSDSFSFEIHREIAGFGGVPSGSPPPPVRPAALASHLAFAEAAAPAPLHPAIRVLAMSADQWASYCRAFA
jgi:hypothetical protein